MRNYFCCFVLCLFSMLSCAMGQSPDTIAPQSTIEITVKGVPAEDAATISGTYILASDGTIRMPMLPEGKQSVRVVGKTARAVEDMLIDTYKSAEIYTTPTFVVRIQAADVVQQLIVHVSGGVKTNKSVPWTRDLTLLGAIVDAGDLSDFGSRYILVTRKGKTVKYDYYKISHRELKLQPGDQIFVTQRGMFEGRQNKLDP